MLFLTGVVLLTLFLVQERAFGVAYVSAGTGDWNTPATWAPEGVPGAGDSVTVAPGHTVTVSSAVTVDAVTIDGGGVLANNSTLSITGALNGAGSLNQGTSAVLALSAEGAPTVTTLDTTTNQPNTVDYNRTGVQTVRSITYSNLRLSGSGAKTWTPSTVNGALTIAGTATYTTSGNVVLGGDLNVQGGAFSVGHQVIVNGGTTLSGGTFTITGGVAANTNRRFAGDVTINGGTWDNAANLAVLLEGSLTYVSGTFTSGTQIYTMTGGGALLSGSLLVNALTVSGTGNISATGSPTVGALAITSPATVTNDGALTVTTSLTGTGTLINGANRTLSYEGTGAPAPVFDMTTNTPNTFAYNRSAGGNQAIKTNTTYHHLLLAGTDAKTGGASSVVNGNLTVSGSAQWTRTTSAYELLGNLVVDSDHATPITGSSGVLTFSTPNPATATVITGSSAVALTLGVVAFDNQSGVSSSKTLDPTTVTVGGGASFTNNGTLTPTALTVSGSASFTNNSTLTATTLTVSGGGTFTNNNAAGTATVTGATSVGSTGTAVNHGTMVANGLISGAGSLVNRANATLEFGMSAANVPTIATLDLSTHTPNTVRYNLGAAQNIRAGTYSNLELTTSGVKTALGALTINGTFTLSGTAAFTTGAHSHVFAGSWVYDSAVATPLVATGSTISFNAPTPAAGTSISGAGVNTLAFATVNVNTASGLTVSKTITSTGPLTVSGSLVNASTGSITMLGGGGVTVANGGSLSNTGVLDLSSGGTLVVGSSGAASATNTGTLTVAGLVDGQGTFTNGVNGTLNYQNATAPTVTTLNLSTQTPNTVNYNLAGAQTIRAGIYANLTLGTSGTKTAAGGLTVNGTMTVSGTAAFVPLGATHTFGGNWVNGGSVTPGGLFIFTGSTAQISGAGTLAMSSMRVATGASVDSLVSISTTTELRVQTGSTLTLGGTVTGVGAFALEDGGTLGIRSSTGIASAGASGAVQTMGGRTFSGGATYIYNNNSGNPQVTGTGLPNSVRALTINNPQGVTLTNTVTVNEALTLTAGSLTNPASNVTVSVLPVVSGTTTVGQTLATTDGTWAGGPAFTYQWQRCSTACADIAGETANTYLLRSDDVGARVRVNVTATDGGTLTVSSLRTAAIMGAGGGGGGGGAPPPVPTATGTPAPPQVLSEPGIGDVLLDVDGVATEQLQVDGPTLVSVTSEGRALSVSVPAGALGTDGEVVLGAIADLEALVEVAPPPAGAAVIVGFIIQAATADGTAITDNFAEAVTITVTVPAADIPPGSTAETLTLVFWNGTEWVVTPATIVVNADGSVTATAQVMHFTAFGLFRQPSIAWSGQLPASGLAFSIWRGFTGTDPHVAAGFTTPAASAVWRLDSVTQRFIAWLRGAPPIVNQLLSLTSGEILILRIGDPPPPRAPRPPTSTPTPAATSVATPAPTGGGTTAAVTYTVTAADTLIGIGARFGVDWLQIATANGIAGPDYFIQPGQVLTIPTGSANPGSVAMLRTHIVRSTDTLSGIGALYNMDWLDIAAANGIVGPNYFIWTGQVLTILASPITPVGTGSGGGERTYVVGAGETLSEIAVALGVPWTVIAEANGIVGPDYSVQIGQVLVIPAN